MRISDQKEIYSIQWEFSERVDGDMRQEDRIQEFLKKHAIDDHSYIVGKQIHGASVLYVDSSFRGKKIPNVDGFVTSCSDTSETLTLGVKTADCMPILFYDKTHGVIGAAHSGWRGTYDDIAEKVIKRMIKTGAEVQTINVIIGPHIRPCCYSVPKDRADMFVKKYGENSYHIEDGQAYLHLEDVVVLELLKAGITLDHIQRSVECTSTLSDKYFSYRKDSHESFGEQIAIISIKRYNP